MWIKVFHVSLLEPALKGVLLEKKCWNAKGVKALESSVCWRWFIISIFESRSRSIIAVRVASARSALATLASAKRGWLTEYKVGSGVWRSWLCRSMKLVASWVRGSTDAAAERLRGSSYIVPAILAGLRLWKPNKELVGGAGIDIVREGKRCLGV